jgi:hypothetical protein
MSHILLKIKVNISLLYLWKYSLIKIIQVNIYIYTNIENINYFQYYMHIIWNEPFESDNLGKGGMTYMVKRVHVAKKVENPF